MTQTSGDYEPKELVGYWMNPESPGFETVRDDFAYDFLEDYQDFVESCSTIYDGELEAYLGLAGEVGEVLDEIKKFNRIEPHTDYSQEHKRIDNIYYELGDVMHYLARIANIYDFSLYDIINDNVQKLKERHEIKDE